MKDENLKNVVENAMDFLQLSIEELLESDNPEKPNLLKYSVIHFHIALELFIKARLLSEHWSLVFSNMKKINIEEYESGDFISVNFRDSIARVNGLSRTDELSKNAIKNFHAVAQHRNRAIHFYMNNSDETREEVIKAQLHAWYNLHTFCFKKWSFLEIHNNDLVRINTSFKGLDKYLDVIYNNKTKEIEKLKNEGHIFNKCPSCKKYSMRHGKEYKTMHSALCVVCDFFAQKSLLVECACGNTVAFYDEGYATCSKCGKNYEAEHVMKELDSGYWCKPGEGPSYPYYCPECDGKFVILNDDAGYMCASCFRAVDENSIHECGRCGQGYVGDDEGDTGAFGCYVCQKFR